MKRLIPFFFIFIFFAGCQRNQSPKGIIPEAEMVGLLADIHVIDGYTNTVSADTLYKYAPIFYHSVFQKHHTNFAAFDTSLKYYSQQPERLQKMYGQVKLNLDRVQRQEENRLKKIEQLRKKAEKEKMLREKREKALALKKKREKEELLKKRKKPAADSISKKK